MIDDKLFDLILIFWEVHGWFFKDSSRSKREEDGLYDFDWVFVIYGAWEQT